MFPANVFISNGMCQLLRVLALPKRGLVAPADRISPYLLVIRVLCQGGVLYVLFYWVPEIPLFQVGNLFSRQNFFDKKLFFRPKILGEGQKKTKILVSVSGSYLTLDHFLRVKHQNMISAIKGFVWHTFLPILHSRN